MFTEYLPIDYLCIDIANNFGDDSAVGFRGDKELFEVRIQWVKDNFSVLEERMKEADNPYLYIKAVMALRDSVAGKATGHMVMLDASCSGIQVMSAMTGCKRGGDITGQIDPFKRSDAYTELTTEMNRTFERTGLGMIKVNRPDAKQAMMTAFYGSKEKPIEIFGKELIPVFQDTCNQLAPGASQLLDTLITAWQPYVLKHMWELPDGFVSHIKVMKQIEADIEIDELNHHKFATKYKKNIGTRTGVSLAANVTHSVDSYLLRSILRRTNYNTRRVTRALKLLTAEVNKTYRTAIKPNNRLNMPDRQQRWELTRMVDASTLDAINKSTIGYLSTAHMHELIKLAATMLEHRPFKMLTVHDAFRTHANNCNRLRFWYKELLAELSESNILSDILSQITGQNIKFLKYSKDMPKYIRNSNYTLG